MKKLIPIFIILFAILSLNLFAQDNNIDVKELVKKQVQIAKEKAEKERKAQAKSNSDNQVDQSKIVTENNVVQNEKVIPDLISDPTSFVLSFIMLDGLGILFILFIILKRKKKEKEQLQNTLFRRNVKSIRENRIPDREKDILSNLRKKIVSALVTTKIDDYVITNAAREYSISKGEIYLAAKIKELELRNATANYK